MVYALDCAASEFYFNDNYELKGEDRRLTSEEFSDYLNSLCSSYPISSIEDALDLLLRFGLGSSPSSLSRFRLVPPSGSLGS